MIGAERSVTVMTRDDITRAIDAQPFDTDVQVNVGGYLIDVTLVRYDERRHSIVLELFADDTRDALVRLLHPGRCSAVRSDPDLPHR